MKNHLATLAALSLGLVLSCSGVAAAEDLLLTAKVERAMQKVNKDGAPYTILFISEDRELQGVSYTAEAPIFAFGPSHQEASAVQGGETIKAIVSRRDNNGDVTYTLRKIVK